MHKYLSGSISSETPIGRFCAIDIGTVTCRMLIADAECGPDGSISLSELDKQYEVVNLGEGVDSTHRLSSKALARTKASLERFLKVRSSFDTKDSPIIDTTVIATSATRDAENSGEFADLVKELGLALSVISGTNEASLSFSGASHAYQGENVVVIDVGGGSTEISSGRAGNDADYSRSLDIGSRRITERFWDSYPPSRERIEAARKWAASFFTDIPKDALCRNRLVAVAGTATSVVTIKLAMKTYDAQIVNGSIVSLSDLQDIENRLSSYSLDELRDVIGLDPRRASVIVGGMMVLEEAMKAIGAKSFTASESDILEGIVMYNAKQHIACNSSME